MHGNPSWPVRISDLLATTRRQPGITALTRTLGVTRDELDLGLHRYLHRSSFAVLSTSLDALAPAPGVTWKPLRDGELAARLASHLIGQSGRSPEAESAAERILAAADSLPEAELIATLAHLRHRQGRWDEARALFERAAYLDVRAHVPWVHFGMFLIDGLGRGEVPAGLGEVPSDAVRAGDVLERAIELAPQFSEPRALLGFTFLYREPALLPRGIELLGEAVRTMPTRHDLVFDLAMLYVRSGELELASERATQLEAAGAGELAASARDVIRRAEGVASTAAPAAGGQGH